MDGELLETKVSSFKENYDEILERQVSPENIDNYADDALNDLIKIRDEITEKHKWDSLTGKDWEDKAFEEEGLPLLEDRLEKIGDKIDIINIAEKRIEEALEKGYEILPEIHDARTQTEGIGGSPKLPKCEGWPKTKTILFILSQAFGENIDSDGPIKIVKGRKSRSSKDEQEWPRRYYRIDAPNQGKYILSCDRLDNKTFIIDKTDLMDIKDDDGNALEIEQLEQMTKTQVGRLVSQMPHSRGINYSQNYSDRILESLSNCPLSDEQSAPIKSGYLAK